MNVSSNVYILVGGQKLTIDQFLSLRQRVGNLRSSSAISAEIRKDLSVAYKFFSDATDALIANAIGASQIRALSGRGFQADNVVIKGDLVDISETKSITTRLDESSGRIVANKIGLGGLNITSIQEIAIAGVKKEGDIFTQATEKFALSSDKEKDTFVKNLRRRTSEDRKKYLNRLSSQDNIYGKAAKQIINNIEIKASKIYVSTPTASGKSIIREIGWTWKDISKNPQARIAISSKGELDVIFSEKLVADVLNNSTKTIEYKNLEEAFAKKLNDIISKSQFSEKTFAALSNFGLTLEKLTEYEKGSVKVYNATITEIITNRKNSKRETPQKVISDSQFTALVQKEVEKRMPKGPLRGPPLSPTVLTYRTGTFVDSIRVIQDLRQSIMTYYYAPNYKIHERKGARAPRLLLQPSIRSVVQDIYSQKFRILRGF
jgi:hypothetical protein